jgi:sRNA-binding regulator protein Hfq
MKRLVYSVLAAFLFLTATALSQSTSVDVLYLKNGSVIRGEVTSLNAKSVKIKTADGSLFVYRMKEVARIEKVTTGPSDAQDSTVADETVPETTVTQLEVPEAPPKPKKTGVHFGIRGGLFVNLEIWDQLASNSYLAKTPDSKIGFGLMGILAPGITIDDDMFFGLGLSVSPNFWTQSQKIAGYNTSTSINGVDVGGNLVFGFDDMYFVLGTGSANVSVTATVSGDSKTIDMPDSAPYRRVMLGWGDGVGFAVSYVSYSGWAQNLSRFEINIGWSF